MSLIDRVRRHTPGYLIRAGMDIIRQSVLTRISTWAFKIKCICFGIRTGGELEVFGTVIIRSPQGGAIRIGNKVQLISSSWRCTASSLNHSVRLRTNMPSAKIMIEDGVGLNGTSITARSKTIRIGEDTMIGPNCTIMDSDFHIPWPPENRSVYPGDEMDAQVDIGSRVWIGLNCMILKGVSIGDNSVIAAGSVVVKDIPEGCLAGGNPARVIKYYSKKPGHE